MTLKRGPNVESAVYWDAEKITKSQWIELFRDLYLQTHGEDTGVAWMTDAQERLRTLKQAGLSR